MNYKGARLRFPFSHQANSANSATEIAPAIETRAIAPAIAAIKSHVTGISVAGTVGPTRIGRRARIASGNVVWPLVLQSSAINVLLRDGQKGLLALGGV